MSTYWAAPVKSGLQNGLTSSDPFSIADFMNIPPSPDDVLRLKNGVYQGSSFVINPPVGLAGTSGHPITVLSDNDGGAEIDGQSARSPLHLSRTCDWWVIQGIDAHSTGGAGAVCGISSNNNIIKRCVFWDGAFDYNLHIVTISGTSSNDTGGGAYNLIEDVGAFGTGRKCFESFDSNGNTFRRIWGRWEGNTNTGPHRVIQDNYHSYNTIIDNAIIRCTGSCMPPPPSIASSYTVTQNGVPYIPVPPPAPGTILYPGIAQSDGSCLISYPKVRDALGLGGEGEYNSASDPSPNGNSVWGGVLVLLMPGDKVGLRASATTLTAPFYHVTFGNTTVNDLFVYAPSGGLDEVNGGSDYGGYKVSSVGAASPSVINRATTIVKGANSVGTGWSVNNVANGLTLAAAIGSETLYDGVIGAKLKYQYQNGVLTTVPLWPWPMAGRIKAATSKASLDGHNHPVEDIDGLVQSVFGLYPSVTAASVGRRQFGGFPILSKLGVRQGR